MDDNLLALATIAAMGAVTYLTRASGFFIASRLQTMPRTITQILAYLPGTIMISILTPQILSGGWVTISGAVLCLGVSLVFKNLMAVMACGVVYVSLLRHLL